MIYLSFPFVISHRSMSGEYDPQSHSLEITTCSPKLIVKTTIKQEGNFELVSGTFVGHLNVSLANTLATIFGISLGNMFWNPYIESIEVLQRNPIAVWEQVIFALAWCTLSPMKTIIETIHLPLKYRHVEGLNFSRLDQSWRFPHTTNYDSGRSSPHSWPRDSRSSCNWWQQASHVPWPSLDRMNK